MSSNNDECRSVFIKQLTHFLKFDTWHIDDAAQLLVGAIPPVWDDPWPNSDGSIPEPDSIIARVEKLKPIWNSNPAHGSHAEPLYFIRWAVKKGMPPPWLSWAAEQGLVKLGEGEGEVSGKSETAHLNIIGALLQLYWDVAHPGSPFKQADVIRALAKYEGIPGMAERNLKDKFTKAIRSIRSA
jgi:hypothetical protein